MSKINNIKGEAAVDENDYKKYRTSNIIAIVICAVLFVVYIPIFAILANKDDLPFWIWQFFYEIPDVLWIIILFTIFIGLSVSPYIFGFKLYKMFIVKKFNHLDNTSSYELSHSTAITPKLAGIGGGKFAFLTTFAFAKTGFASGLSMVKINIDGKELSIFFDSSVSSTTASSTLSAHSYSIGNRNYTTGSVYTDYTTKEFSVIHLTREQFLFLSKLPTCQKAVMSFIGRDGSIALKWTVNKRTKLAITLIIQQIESLSKQNCEIFFK